METITFEKLPEAVGQIKSELFDIKQLILNQSKTESDKWFDIIDFCEYHPDKPAKATVYTWVRERRVPFHKKGKKLAFLKSEIDNWIKQGRQKTASEIFSEADNFIKVNRKKPP